MPAAVLVNLTRTRKAPVPQTGGMGFASIFLRLPALSGLARAAGEEKSGRQTPPLQSRSRDHMKRRVLLQGAAGAALLAGGNGPAMAQRPADTPPHVTRAPTNTLDTTTPRAT